MTHNASHIHIYTHIHTHTLTHIYTYTHTYTHTHTHIHTYTHIHIYTHIHTHIHTPACQFSIIFVRIKSKLGRKKNAEHKKKEGKFPLKNRFFGHRNKLEKFRFRLLSILFRRLWHYHTATKRVNIFIYVYIYI